MTFTFDSALLLDLGSEEPREQRTIPALDLSGSISQDMYETVLRRFLPDESQDDLPEQEWCEDCALSADPAEPGMPRDVVDCFTEADPTWDFELGDGPLYEIRTLSCGHQVSGLCGTASAPTLF